MDDPTVSSNTPMVNNTTTTIPATSLQLTNPDTILSGTNRGTQFIGSSTLQIDNSNNIINISDPTTAGGGVLKLGVVAAGGFLGLAVSDGTNDILFAGRESDGSIVVKIAESGVDVKTATDSQLIFNSSQDIFKVVLTNANESSPVTLTPSHTFVAGTTITATIPHNLNITPAFQVYVTNPIIAGYVGSTGITSLPSIFFQGGAAYLYNQARADNTNLYIDLSNTFTSNIVGLDAFTWTYVYYILQQTATQ